MRAAFAQNYRADKQYDSGVPKAFTDSRNWHKSLKAVTCFVEIVGEGGLEPPRPEGHWHLKPARLPFRHSPQQPGEPITQGTPLPNHADPPLVPAKDPNNDHDQPADLPRSDSQNTVGPAAMRWADTMQVSTVARRHAGVRLDA
jgi:hypothetical protein